MLSVIFDVAYTVAKLLVKGTYTGIRYVILPGKNKQEIVDVNHLLQRIENLEKKING
jgi:hypothetical protein